MTPKTTEQQGHNSGRVPSSMEEEYNRLVEAIESIGRQRVFEEDDEEDFREWEEGGGDDE